MSVKRLVVTVFGGTIFVIGLALLVLPGPAFVVIPLGLAVLATEYVWARRWLKRARNMANPRKAKRTTRVYRQAFARRWERWRCSFRHWLAGRGNRPPAPGAPGSGVSAAPSPSASIAPEGARREADEPPAGS